MDRRLENGLLRLTELMEGETAPWWIIGSTALVISGIDGITPDDIDVVADGDTLRRKLAKAGVVEIPPAPHAKFRSNPYGRIKVDGGVDIEFQGDLDLWENGACTRMVFVSRIQVVVGNAAVFVPEIEEQYEIFRRFGRPKDLAKAKLIENYIVSSNRPSGF